MLKKLALSALLIAGCGATAPAPQPTPQIVYVTPAPTPVPTAVPTLVPTPVPTLEPTFEPEPTLPPYLLVHKEGDPAVAFTADDGACEDNIRVIRVVKWTSDNQFVSPDRGNRFITAEISVTGVTGTCADSQKGYLAFSVATSDGIVFDPEPAWREPQLPYDSDMNLRPGRTYKGWVTFQFPKTLTHGLVYFGDSEWTFTL